MDDSFILYLERLELMAFFAGYPLIYLLVVSVAGTEKLKRITRINIASLLAYSYAVTGLLYVGLMLKNLYPDLSLEHIRVSAAGPFLKIWALSSLLFFIPAIAKRPVLSLLHSMVFFFLLLRDLFLPFTKQGDQSLINNDMRVYSFSLILNLITFVFVWLVCLLTRWIKKRSAPADVQ